MHATLERLYAAAAETDTPGAAEFLDRMAWLPALVDEIAADDGDFAVPKGTR